MPENQSDELSDGIPGLPELTEVIGTRSGYRIMGFSCPGVESLAWWRRLRDAHPATGLWPVLMDAETPRYFALDTSRASVAAEAIARDEFPAGEEILRERGRERLELYGSDLAGKIRAELRGEGDWPAEIHVWPAGTYIPGFRLPRLPSVLVTLVPAQQDWQVPAVFGYGPWNEYPDPIEHAAILRFWRQRWGTALVAMTGTTVELELPQPPATRDDALALAWQYSCYNDGDYDIFGAESLTELAAALTVAEALPAWWD